MRGSWWCNNCNVGAGDDFDKKNPFKNCVICGREIEGKAMNELVWYCPVPFCKYAIQRGFTADRLPQVQRNHYLRHLKYFSLNVGMYSEFRWFRR